MSIENNKEEGISHLKKIWKVGDIRNGYPVLAQKDRKKILLLADDLRMNSGIATMAREFVLGTCHHYNWIQLAAAVNHDQKGQRISLNESIEKDFGIPEPNVFLYPNDGYGNPDTLRWLLKMEKPDGILHYTDPRSWIWLYEMEREIRQHIPIMYYNVWDDLPYPQYNESYYDSCDLIMNISKQTNNIVKQVCVNNKRTNKDCVYIPHGIDIETYKPIPKNDEELVKFKQQLFGNKDYKFILLYINRNIKRKSPSDLIAAYKLFVESLPKYEQDQCLLIFKTDPIDNHGTNLPAVYGSLASNTNIMFLNDRYPATILNYLYNIADVGMNMSSAEGFGLSCAESLMAGTPIIATSIGGLQDQMRFEDKNGNWYTPDINHPSNLDKKLIKCGEWAFPLWPQSNLVGSPPTPYIYDSRANIKDIILQLKILYDMGRKKRKHIGLLGRKWMIGDEAKMTASHMSEAFIKYMNNCMKKFKPQDRYKFTRICSSTFKSIENKGLYDEMNDVWV